jgi:23S rRNA (cytidine2498-2'-O)-methyltransferase
VHLVLAAEDSKAELATELSGLYRGGVSEPHPGLFACAAEHAAPLHPLVFARQILPDAAELQASSIRAWATLVVDAVAGVLPDAKPWSLHVFPFQGVHETARMGARAVYTNARTSASRPAREPREARSSPPKDAGVNRCTWIVETVEEILQKRRRHLLRALRREPGAFGEEESLVQLVLTSPEQGFLSVAQAPAPFEARGALSFFPGGQLPIAVDKAAPSRAFAKLVEAEARLGIRIATGETCVDLGAAPGSWTYVAAKRGARVTSVDRSPLRDDLMRNRNVRFERADAFRFEPEKPVDWLLCDVIAAAERSSELLLRWLENAWCRRFVVTLKLDDAGSRSVLDELAQKLPKLTRDHWLLHLCANKKEVCAFGVRHPK